jgi:hypothetical protein
MVQVLIPVGHHALLLPSMKRSQGKTRALSIQKSSEFVKNEHAQYTLERYER